MAAHGDSPEPQIDYMRLCDLADAINNAGSIESKQKMIQMMPTAAECHEAMKFLKRLGYWKEVKH